ncbi:uncharacterized protein LOC135834962 [Planococcus citri]|uniref:uncharacterized protein LOC135834962 n=1 Tax=Planococcus citri TaxID=170843 RepID=UPI0031F8D63A
MNKEYICECCGHSITECDSDDDIYVTTCRHIYHYHCLYRMIYEPTEKEGNRWITRCKRCKSIIETTDCRKIDFHVRTSNSTTNGNDESEQQWKSMAMSLSSECTQIRNELEQKTKEYVELLSKYNAMRNQQHASLFAATTTPTPTRPQPVAPAIPIEPPQAPSLFLQAISQSTFYESRQPTINSVNSLTVGIRRSGESVLNMPQRHTFGFDNQRNDADIADRRKIIEQRRAITAASERTYQPPVGNGTKRSWSESSNSCRTAAYKHTRGIPNTSSKARIPKASSPGTNQGARKPPPNLPAKEKVPPPLVKKGTTREKGSNVKKYRQRYNTDPEELRPFYPLNSFPYDFMACGYEINQDNHYIAFFAHEIILIGDGHISAMAHKLAKNKPYQRKLNPNLYRRNLTIKALYQYLQKFSRFPKRIMISIGNFDVHLGTATDEFGDYMEKLCTLFSKFGVTEIILVPLLPNPRAGPALSEINQVLSYDWGTTMNCTTTRLTDIFDEILQYPSDIDHHGPSYELNCYHEILQQLATRFIPPVRYQLVKNQENEDDEPAEQIQHGVERMATEHMQQDEPELSKNLFVDTEMHNSSEITSSTTDSEKTSATTSPDDVLTTKKTFAIASNGASQSYEASHEENHYSPTADVKTSPW